MTHDTAHDARGKRRPPIWVDEMHQGRPLLRGILIAPSPRQLRYGETYIIAVRCLYCGRTHTHGWPGGPERTSPEHRAAHCVDVAGAAYYVAPAPAVEVVE